MRIIGGEFKGAGLAAVGKGDKLAHLRPTTDRVRESLFNHLEHGGYEPMQGSRVLDLFAGTGALGFEALSRGASHVHFIENGRAAGALIRENTNRLRVLEKVGVSNRDATRQIANPDEPYGLVFLDPPYGKGLGYRALVASAAGRWLACDALIVWEENAEQMAPENFVRLDSRKYGDTWVTILRYDLPDQSVGD